ncbi:MAG: fumarate hydratase [Piscinibacter sp.]|uniref:fumarate hydratase n=1 Tax=Piscinibacter sp. TaxID=1903157 RepID=UPI001B52B2CF|nr:fumarate hydratase [Piscinibacter sp.]MBP5991258.1 fumarate hydratase [Piscinibacter sp.]MBP6026563.1 fumarate hydratase [Piscinibacter sp.]
MPRRIQQEDLADSLARALQFISHHHPPDFVRAMRRAHAAETHAPAKAAIEQILVNSRLAALGRRPLCQDTGVVQVFLRVGVEVQFGRRDGQAPVALQRVADEAVRRAYTDPINPLRASMVRDPLGERRNTRDNTPAIVHTELVDGDRVEVLVAAKGGGGDVKARFATLNPSDSVANWVIEQLPGMGAGWCPPGVLGIGIGGSPEQAMLLAKQAVFEPIDIDALRQRGPADAAEALRLELHERINALGIGAQGLGGLSTVLDVKVATAPCHAATIPIALVPNCAATRYIRFTLDGTGPARFEEPDAELWAGIPDRFEMPDATAVDLNLLDRQTVASWRVGQTLLLSGRVLTARDAAHKRLVDLLERGQPLPVDLRGRVIYYVGPVDAVAGEAVGPAGPTTATRMDKFVGAILSQCGVLAMIGKAERSAQTVADIRRHGAAYLAAVGGAAYLLSKAIRAARVVAFDDLGMEAIHEFELREFPVTVAVDAKGRTVYRFIEARTPAPE